MVIFFLSSGIATHKQNINKITSCYIINVVKMTNKNKKVNELKIFDLLKEAFSIPDGWKEEVYVEDGYVTFSSPMTQSTHTGIDAYTPLPEYVADLQSFRIGDFEGFNEREDGSIEADGEILTREEAIDAIATTYEEDYQPNSRDANSDPILQLYYDLLHPRAIFKDGVVRCERCGVEIWEDAECDCGVDGSDHEGLDEAYANKREAE